MERLIPDIHQGAASILLASKEQENFLIPTPDSLQSQVPVTTRTSPYALLGQPWTADLKQSFILCNRMSNPLFPSLKQLQDLRCASWKCFLTFSHSARLISPDSSLLSKQLEMASSKHGVAELHLLSLPGNVTEHRCFPVTLFIYSDAENWDVSRCHGNLP